MKKIKDFKHERKIKERRQAVLSVVVIIVLLTILTMTGVIQPCDAPIGCH